jgi:hypothetical protein
MLAWLNPFRRAAAAPAATPPVAPPPRRVVAEAEAAPAPAPAPVALPDGPSVLAWLLDADPPAALPLAPQEAALVALIDAELAAPRLPADLLPRAAGVLPHLMRLMRHEQPSRVALAQQVLRDMVLTKEVLRLARSSYYGSHDVPDLESALDRIGMVGLQAATARVLLKPVFDMHGDGLAARAAARLWQHAELKSMVCAELASQHGAERFDALLAGLAHDMGWLALLRLTDQLQPRAELPGSLALDRALSARRDRLFGRLTADWALTPALTEFSDAMARLPASHIDLPLAHALRDAERHCAETLAPLQPATVD